MSKQILIVGSGGRLGSAMMEHFAIHHGVVGFDHKQLDLADINAIEAALGKVDYSHLVLAGALTGVDYCENHPEEAYAVNAEGPGRIAEISAAKGAHMTYISTDMVFDGLQAQPYLETDVANPISVYGASKLAGEERVLAASPGNLAARISWVFGPGRPAFPDWIIEQARARADLTLPEDKTACPTYTLDVIEWLDALVFGRKEGSASGVFHLCNSQPCTWLEWGRFCLDAARGVGVPMLADRITGVPMDSVTAFVARRPRNSALSTEKFGQWTGICPRPWRDAIREHVTRNCLRATPIESV